MEHKVNKEGTQPVYDKVEAITKEPSPLNVSELAQVLPGFDQLQCEVSAKFVKAYSLLYNAYFIGTPARQFPKLFVHYK